MSDFILARVSQTLAAEQSLETLVRQLLEMLEAVTRMESTYLTRIDTNAQRQQIMFAHNSSEMQIPEGFSVPWDESLCKRALEDQSSSSRSRLFLSISMVSKPLTIGSAIRAATAFWCRSANDSPLSRAGKISLAALAAMSF